MGFFKYIVRHYDEIDKKEITARGIVYAGSYAEATQKLENYFCICAILGLYGLEPSEIYDFDYDDNFLFKVAATEVKV